MATEEKQQIGAIQHQEHNFDSGSEKNHDYVEFSPREQRRITRRLDLRLVLTTGIVYCVSLMDRTNLSAASLAGMNIELRMNAANNGYSITTLVFFVSYIIFQPPATILTRKIGPRIFLSALAFGWGVVMIGMGLVNTWPELAGLRVILGVFEAGYFPGAVYLLSTWYTRYEMGKRYAVFYIIGCVASAFAGILAFGLMQMDGIAGKTGWRWIFIIEGIITCLIGIGAYVFLVSFPDDGAEKAWGFLKKAEIDWIIRKVDADRGDVALEPFTIGRFMRGGADWKIWVFALMFCFSTTVSYALAYFLPIILRAGMGFSVGEAQCLVAPPFVFAGIWMYLCGWYGDKYKLRAPVIATNAILQVVGLCLMGYAPTNAVKYFGVFLACAGANCSVPAILTYQANNIRGQWKRAFCSASLVGFGGIGGIIGSLVFRPQDAPRYLPGLWATMVASGLVLIMVGILTLFFKAQNAKADRGELNIEGSEEGFRYTY
ncbi:major facilitator superfamily domain-containing protein [Elsinoe ampelina]|uniref:Major facilitator superfamily domain-containing protein n=1 Tax=Elsinoe ampelina TaxID=302913 RepID=A0A6A6G1B4_9PEZI|nr:major facilitator superfamily domain-containing protein [Elsinoe ampelina]